MNEKIKKKLKSLSLLRLCASVSLSLALSCFFLALLFLALRSLSRRSLLDVSLFPLSRLGDSDELITPRFSKSATLLRIQRALQRENREREKENRERERERVNQHSLPTEVSLLCAFSPP